MPHRDRRNAGGRSPTSKDAIEKRAEEDLARMQKLLQRTKAEVARSKKLADRLERRSKRDGGSQDA